MLGYARTTILLHPALLEQVRMFSKERGKSMTEVFEESLRQLLAQSESVRIQRTYDALKALEGTGQRGITDASTTINKVLYGENGAWKGQRDA